MIHGTGDIAKMLISANVDRPLISFFAQGVSNSKEGNLSEFAREINHIHNCPKEQHLIYFSSLAIYYTQSHYTEHKIYMERLIKEKWNSFTIIRLGNITWGNNPRTIINFFKTEHAAGRTPELQDTYRYLITKDEFIHWMKLIPIGFKNEMNIPGEMIHVKQIWQNVKDGKY